jgi:hypothetical protein
MASLYSTSQNARKALIGILALFVVIIGWDTINSLYNSQAPIGTTARRFYMNPDDRFGVLPDLEIDSISLAEDSNPSFSLRQPTFPTYPDVAYVYQVQQPVERLTTYEDAISKAAILGFDRMQLLEEGRNMIWRLDDQTKSLIFNRDTFQWTMETDYVNNIEAIRNKIVSTQSANYTSNALNLLRRFVFDPNSYNFGFRDAQQQVATYANVGPSGLFYEVQNSVEAEYVRVDIYRTLPQADLKPTNEQPELLQGEVRPVATVGNVYREDPRVGILSLIASNNFNDYPRDLFKIDFTDYVYTGNTGKYLIISPAEAWTKVQSGDGALVSLVTQDIDRFTDYPVLNVRRFEADPLQTQLGYFEPREWNGYVIPIYLIKGVATLDNGRLANFTFYVNAISERVVD